MRKIKGYAVAGLSLLLVGSTPFLATQMADAQDTIIEVVVGGGDDGMATNIFRAKEITVNVDTTVHFAWEYLEPHTVTFGIPTGNPTLPTAGAGTEVIEYTGTEYINSGFIGGPTSQLDVKFTTTGSFDYFCVVHPTMVGTINVVETGGETQAEIDARGDAEYAESLEALQELDEELDTAPQTVTPKDGGGNTYEIVVGGDTFDGAINKFYPDSQTITTADTIEWTAIEFTPHTVTFGQLIPQGDPTEIEPIVPDDGVWDGEGLVHSGTLGTGWDGGTSFSLSFSTPGTYEYYCLLHAEMGQLGTITVTQAATPTPSPTATSVPTNTPVPTATSVPPTNTAVPTATSVPPTSTVVPATATSVPPTAVPSTIPKPPNTGDGISSGSTTGFSFFAAAGLLVVLGSAGVMFATRRK